jgi:hypothetical protein
MMMYDFSSYDLPSDVYADGIGAVENLGENFRTVLFTFQRSDGGILRKVPVLCVVRPKSSLLLKDGPIARQLLAQGDPRTARSEARLHS